MTLIPRSTYRTSSSKSDERKSLTPLHPSHANGRGLSEANVIDLRANRIGSLTVPVGRRPSIYHDAEVQGAKATLEKLFVPLARLKLFHMRRSRLHKKNSELRKYTVDSIVQAYRGSNSIISTWPSEVLTLLAEGAQHLYLEGEDIIVYDKECYLSMGIVIVLYGEVHEVMSGSELCSTPDRKFSTVRHREISVLCEKTVLCRDVSPSCLKRTNMRTWL
uniref:Uncharacterized protein TCIL3000_10_4370 n=1 Tax=Trypanosoma congolense (strain IL3000) TaxID=1068625 RepID=G0UWA8_TRYCI|nr:unnamed protein product [Trypanosoma congolense IL3000]